MVLAADIQDKRRPDPELEQRLAGRGGHRPGGSGVKKSGSLAVPIVTTWWGGRPSSRRQSIRVHSEIVRSAVVPPQRRDRRVIPAPQPLVR